MSVWEQAARGFSIPGTFSPSLTDPIVEIQQHSSVNNRENDGRAWLPEMQYSQHLPHSLIHHKDTAGNGCCQPSIKRDHVAF